MQEICENCKNKILLHEIYTDWFYCLFCNKNFAYHRERTNPEDAKSVCDVPSSENK